MKLNRIKKITPLGAFLLTALILCILSIVLGLYNATAQTYYTNANGSVFGAQQYNQNFANPAQPSQTIARQYLAGLESGTITATGTNIVTVSYPTNIYTQAPVILLTTSTTNVWASASAVTISNFVLNTTGLLGTNQVAWSNGISVYWLSIGH